jgi:hypothetical protein
MKPELVDLEEIFKENSSIFLKEKKPVLSKQKNIDYKFSYNSLFNFLGLCILIIGLYFLNKRKKEKEERKKDFERKIYKLKDIIKNNEFIL